MAKTTKQSLRDEIEDEFQVDTSSIEDYNELLELRNELRAGQEISPTLAEPTEAPDGPDDEPPVVAPEPSGASCVNCGREATYRDDADGVANTLEFCERHAPESSQKI